VTIEATSSSRSSHQQRRLQGALLEGEPLRQDRRPHLHHAGHRPPIDLTRYQVLNCYSGPRRPHQQRRRVQGRQRSGDAIKTASSTSAPAAWASSRAARPSSAR
jgi:hypothetical protein